MLCTCDSGAASIKLCQVLVEFGMTNPKSKFHSSKHRPLNRTFCSILNFSIGSIDEKLISLNNGLKTYLTWILASDWLTWTPLCTWESSSAPWPRAPRQECWGLHYPATSPVQVVDQFSISGSPATESCPCLRRGGSSNSLGIPTRCLQLWLAFCESVKLWRWSNLFWVF